MVSILSVGGYFVRANGGCQTPCLVISACTVAETALASTPPPGHVAATLSREVGGPRANPRTGALGASPLVCGPVRLVVKGEPTQAGSHA